jgi:hypothetical protein
MGIAKLANGPSQTVQSSYHTCQFENVADSVKSEPIWRVRLRF